MVPEANQKNIGQSAAAGLPANASLGPTNDFYMRQTALEYAVKAGADIDSVIGTASSILKFLKGETSNA